MGETPMLRLSARRFQSNYRDRIARENMHEFGSRIVDLLLRRSDFRWGINRVLLLGISLQYFHRRFICDRSGILKIDLDLLVGTGCVDDFQNHFAG